MEPLMLKIRRAKIYYIPGLVSFVFLPFVFFILNYSPPSEGIIHYSVPRDVHSIKGDNSYLFSGERLMHSIEKKKIFSFSLDSNYEMNNVNFFMIRIIGLYLKKAHDTCCVIKVHLGSNMTYGEFIKLINYMTIDDHGRYAEWKDDFYILPEVDLTNVTAPSFVQAYKKGRLAQALSRSLSR